MNRKIKFRGWYKENKDSIGEMADWNEVKRHSMLWIDTDFPNNSYKYMQFTGLKDKNSVEIYEGDIVKHTFSPGREEIITVEPVENLIDLLLSLRNWKGWLGDINNKFEVIGNIYQNPELLK